MEKLFYLKIKFKVFIFYFIFFFLLKNNALCQSFEITSEYVEGPLIYSHETNLLGVSKISPVSKVFSKYTYLELSLVKTSISYPSKWLKDKVYDELGAIAETERLLNSKDSPLSDPIFDQFKHLPIYIDDAIQQLAINPLVFCRKINTKYNKTGKFLELNCTIPFGFFNNYLILRLQYENNNWYFTKMTTLNYNRLLELFTIADSFEIKK